MPRTEINYGVKPQTYEIMDRAGWYEQNEKHQVVSLRYLLHGCRDGALFRLVLDRHTDLIPYGSSADEMEISAQLHDIGKPFVTGGDTTLWERITLDEGDYEKIERHPGEGLARLYRASNGTGAVPDAAYHITFMHHEPSYPTRFPQNLIPPFVQLFRVVDHVIGMGEGPQEQRLYKEKGWTLSESYTTLNALGLQKNKINIDYMKLVFEILKQNEHMKDPRLQFLGSWD